MRDNRARTRVERSRVRQDPPSTVPARRTTNRERGCLSNADFEEIRKTPVEFAMRSTHPLLIHPRSEGDSLLASYRRTARPSRFIKTFNFVYYAFVTLICGGTGEEGGRGIAERRNRDASFRKTSLNKRKRDQHSRRDVIRGSDAEISG